MTGLTTANPAVAVPLLTINGWILMQRKVPVGSVSFNQNWAAYRDGFGSATGNDNYWLGLDKVYRLMQLYSVKLRVEVGYTYEHCFTPYYFVCNKFVYSFSTFLRTSLCHANAFCCNTNVLSSTPNFYLTCLLENVR